MKRSLLILFSLFCFAIGHSQEVKKKKSEPQRPVSTATISETDKAKVREDIKKRREQNKVEMEKARKAVKEQIATDTVTK